MIRAESSADLLNLPEHTSPFKLTEFVVNSPSLRDADGESIVIGGGFIVVNRYGEFPISVGRVDIGILENHTSSSIWVDVVEPPSTSKTSSPSSSVSSSTTPWYSPLGEWDSEEDAINFLRRKANASSHKCASTDFKMGGCGVVLYFTHVDHDNKENRKLLMKKLALEINAFDLASLLLLPGNGIYWTDLKNLRESCSSYKERLSATRRPRSYSFSEGVNTPVPKLTLPKRFPDSPSDCDLIQLDTGSKFAAYSAYGSISTLAYAKGWVKKLNKQSNHHRAKDNSIDVRQSDRPKIVLLGLTSVSSELFRLLKKDGRYDISVSDPNFLSSEFEALASSCGITEEHMLDWSDALYTKCHILMQSAQMPITTITEDVIDNLKCLAFLTLSDNVLPSDKDDRESVYFAFEKNEIFDSADGICDLGAFAKIYSLSQEERDAGSNLISVSNNSFTITESYQMGVKVMEKAIHLDGIVQQYSTEEKHQFYSMILEEEEILDDITGDHLGLGTMIGNSSDRMTEWMWNKAKAMCPAIRNLNSRGKKMSNTSDGNIHYLDLGAGNGSAARWICKQDPNIMVKCLNISPPEYSNSFDGCISQDSFLHSFDKQSAFSEALRVTKGGGWLMISDLMCGEALDVTSKELQKFAERNNVMNWVTPTHCVEIAKAAGWSDVAYTDCTAEIRVSFQGLLTEVKSLIDSKKYKGINLKLLQTQRLKLSTRLGQIDRGVFTWGILSARKPYDVVFKSKPPVIPDKHPMMNYSTNDIDGNLKFGTDVVVLTIKDQMPREKIMELPSTTRLIVTMSAGQDHIDLNAAEERGIKVERAARDQLVKSVADYTLSSLIFMLRDGFGNIGVPFPGAKNWTLAWNSDGVDLDRSKIGFIGIGKIVEETCRRIRALSNECEIVYHIPQGIRSSFQEGTFRTRHVGIADLLSTCDAIIVLCPLTSSTDKLIGYKEFSMMKRSAVFINMARGKIVCTEGMTRAMDEKIIKHALLDTTQPEPLPKSHKLWNLDNVTILPHFATNTQYVRKELVEDIPNQIQDSLEGLGILRLEEQRKRKELTNAYKLTREFGMDELVWNHISILLSDGMILHTPGMLLSEDVSPKDLVKTDGSDYDATSVILHKAIYEERSDINAVVHLQTQASVAVSCLEMGFKPLAREAAVFVDRVASLDLMERDDLESGKEQMKVIQKAVQNPKYNTLLLNNEGFCCFGKTLREAWALAYYFDKACRTQLSCLSTGSKLRYPNSKMASNAKEQMKFLESLPGPTKWQDAFRNMKSLNQQH